VLDDTSARAAVATLGTWYVLAASAVAASHTGDTNETTLATITVPAGAMGANGVLRVSATWNYTSSANNKTFRARLGGLAGDAFHQSTQTTSTRWVAQFVFQNSNNQAVQKGGILQGTGGFGSSSSTVSDGDIDTSSAQDIVLTAQLANTGETITLQQYTVELFYQA
jgi:hypothetical protein